MRTIAVAVALAVAASSGSLSAREPTRISDAAMSRAAQLRDAALKDDTAWKVTESLTTEIGPRLAGSEADARAVEWAKAKFKSLGFDRVWTEPVTFPKWERRSESARVIGAHAQPLQVTALGGSPGGTVQAPVARFASLEDLQAAAPGSLAGRIAFVDVQMPRSRTGEGYGLGSRVRGAGPTAAAKAGAVGYLMRSAGTDFHRNPHTGISRFQPGVAPIPMAALSLPDADQLARLVALGAPVTVKLALDCGWNGEYTSQNVIGEITGRSRPDEVVVIGGHLDSWDLGTGAIDDAAGIGITMAAGQMIGRLPKAQRPARSIRVLAFANEEQGLHGGRAYAEAHKAQIGKHAIGAESDLGAGRIYAFAAKVPAHATAAIARIARVLAPLGIEHREDGEGCGPDLSPFNAIGMACAGLSQDATRYFDLHHTADDTLDKIDRADLAQNAAAYVAFAYLAADADGDFGSALKDPADKP